MRLPMNPTFADIAPEHMNPTEVAGVNRVFWSLWHRFSPTCTRAHLGILWEVLEDAVLDPWEPELTTRALRSKALRTLKRRHARLNPDTGAVEDLPFGFH